MTYDAKGNKVKTELVNEYNRATAESVKEALNGKKEEEKKEEKKEEKPAATTQKSNDVMTDADKKQRSDLCDKQSEGVRADCKICANKNTKSEYKSCMKELPNKLNAAANAAANQEMEKWCKQKGAKEECFYAPEGADANLTAACKKCGFKMASPSK